jgi:hypothetical protein
MEKLGMNDYLSKKELSSYLSKMELLYRPPGRSEHLKITEYLDEVEHRLQRIEDAIAGHEGNT